jgi:hypothetical protein
MVDHTSVPWASIWGGRYIVPANHAKRPIGGSVHLESDRDRYAQQIAYLLDDRHGRGNASGNADAIIRAVNAHDELVATLKEAREFIADELEVRLSSFEGNDFLCTEYVAPAERLLAAIDAAISKAAAT